MQRLSNNYTKSYDLSNCFGFSENDNGLSLWEKSSVLNETSTPLEFQPNKPYRLALYVRPNDRTRLQRTRNDLLRKITEKQPQNKKNGSMSSSKLGGKGSVKTSRRVNERVSAMLFDENIKPESVSKRFKKTPEKKKSEKNVTIEVSSSRKSVLKELNTKSLTKSKQSKVRRSYERKFKEKTETENVPEPPSEQIIKELEFKKLSRTRQKKTAKEELEFEKWASNINSDFDDVDKFELSIAYD